MGWGVAVNPEDLGPSGRGRRGSSEGGVGFGPQICVKHFSVSMWESLPSSPAACRSACVPVSMRVLRAQQQGVHDSWQHVLSWSHVFLLLTLNIYSTADRDIWCLFIICSWSLNRAINGAF